jgi:hypothetical protein
MRECEIVEQVLRSGGSLADADSALDDYMTEKDSHMPGWWRRNFIDRVIKNMGWRAQGEAHLPVEVGSKPTQPS